MSVFEQPGFTVSFETTPDISNNEIVSGSLVGNLLTLTKTNGEDIEVDLSTLSSSSRTAFRGILDPSTDPLPTTDVQPGDYYFINGNGNFGNINGVNDLNEGDHLYFVGQISNDPTNLQNWQGIQQNTNDNFTQFVSLQELPQLSASPFNSGQTLTFDTTVLATGSIRDFVVIDRATDIVVTHDLTATITANLGTGRPNLNLTANTNYPNGVLVYMSGTA